MDSGIEHALFENVVEFRGCVRRLDFMQETAGVGAQSHVLPDGGVESRGVGMRNCIPDRFFEHGPGEWRVAVLVHEPWVDGSIPRDIPAAQAVLPVSGAQIEEFAAETGLRRFCSRMCRRSLPKCSAERRPHPCHAGRSAFRRSHCRSRRSCHADRCSRYVRTTGIRRLIVGGSGWVKQRDLRVDESRFA